MLAFVGRQDDLVAKYARIRTHLDEFLVGLPVPAVSHLQVRRLLAVIHRDPFDAALNAAQARRRAGIGNNNASTWFRHHVGTGIREYLEELRLEAAAHLLAQRELDIEVYLIGLSVGYEHQETFCRAFRRRYGCTPSFLRHVVGEG
jgi:AraC-like DNA-binding protein